jgi:hypothetical protein
VLDDAVLFEDFVECGERPASVTHKIFRDDFEPVDNRLAGKDMAVMGNAQANSDAVILKRIEAITGHQESFADSEWKL